MPSTRISPLSLHDALPILALRGLQQETGGFTELVPLPFVHMEAPIYLKGGARQGPTFREALLMHAVARLALHPWFTNIQASWVRSEEHRLNSSHQIISYAVHSHLPPFPTRRSSDLGAARPPAGDGRLHRARAAAVRAHGGADLPEGRRAAGADLPRGAPDARRRPARPPPVVHEHPGVVGEIGRAPSELQSPDHLVCRPLASPPFPYTTLFRSWRCAASSRRRAASPSSCRCRSCTWRRRST